MLDCLTALAHRLRVLVEPPLRGFEHVLVFPPRDAALLSGRATILDRAAAACVGRIAMQLLPMFLGSERVLEFLARRAAIDILFRQIDEVLLAEATFRLRARGHRLGQRHGDPRAIASQDLNAVEVATIGDGIELIGVQNGLRLFGDVRKLCAIRAHIRHLVRDDEMALGIDRDLHIVTHDAGAATAVAIERLSGSVNEIC